MQKDIKNGSITLWILGLFGACFLLGNPVQASRGVIRGLELSQKAIIPSMFPFFICTRLLLQSRAQEWLGTLFSPILKIIGIPVKRASGAVVCALLGGFAAGAQSVGILYQEKSITQIQAQRLLIFTTISSPAFVVGTVGVQMLHNPTIGWILFFSQCLAALLCTILWGFFQKEQTDSSFSAKPSCARCESISFSKILEQSVYATAILCGYVTLFSFILAVSENWTPKFQFLFSVLLEVTNASQVATHSNFANSILLCASALSLVGISVLLQVRTFSGSNISLKPLIFSRLLHLPLMLGFTTLITRMIPVSQATAIQHSITPVMRLPIDAACVAFILCAVIFCGKSSLPKGKKRI